MKHWQKQMQSYMKKAVITGASSGIGEQVARLLLQEGWQIAVAARRMDRLKELQSNYGSQRVSIMQIDVTDEHADDSLVELIEQMGGMNLYFHASGIGFQNYGLDKETELRTVRTNCEGFVRMVDCAFNYFKEHPEQSGHIAVISSIAGTRGLGAAPAYSATKAMQNTYLQALVQLSNMMKYNIRFTDIRPGFVATDLLNDNRHYPMLMKREKVAKLIVKAIKSKKRVAVIDFRYAIMVFLWRLIPSCIWERLPVKN